MKQNISMQFSQFKLKNDRWYVGMLAALAVVFAYLYLRSSSLYPIVFADEWIYSNFSRLSPLQEAIVPSYLYLWIYGSTNVCGDSFLSCARILNIIFYLSSAPFIFMIARTVCQKKIAVVVTLLSILLPTSTYTAYFMPESLYFFSFSVFAWIAITRKDIAPFGYGVLTGTIIGVMALVKVHALFLLPALSVFIVFLNYSGQRRTYSILIGIAAAITATSAAFITKLALGYVFVGPTGLHLLGDFYGAHANNSNTSLASLVRLLPTAAVSLEGHMMALILLFSLPFTIAITSALPRFSDRTKSNNLHVITVFAILMLGAVLAMTVLYTASIASAGPIEGLRLHLRYYDFIFPLLSIIGATQIHSVMFVRSRISDGLIALGVVAGLMYSAQYLLIYFYPSLIDGPAITALIYNTKSLAFLMATPLSYLVGLQLLIICIWVFNRRLAGQLFLFMFLPAYVIISELAIDEIFSPMKQANAYDRAGIFAHKYLNADQRHDLSIAGSDLAGISRAMFHVDSKDVGTTLIADGALFDPLQIPGRKKWLLIVGVKELPPEFKPEVANAEYALVSIKSRHEQIGTIAFSAPMLGDVLDSTEGLAGPESFGSWSNAKQVRLNFKSVLPEALSLFVKVHGFGPNIGKDFTLRVGNVQKTFKVSALPQELFFQLQTDGNTKTITIDIPQPISPKTLGMGDDIRTLGLGLSSLEIGRSDR
jgi:phosphoglycerol transferase